jgi:hypothetical protein
MAVNSNAPYLRGVISFAERLLTKRREELDA